MLKILNFENFTPAKLASWLLFTSVSLGLILFYPIWQVFEGRFILKQKIILFENLIIDFEYLKLTNVAKQLGLEMQLLIGDLTIRYYSIFILLGVLLGYAMSIYLAKRQGINSVVIDRLLVGLVFFGLIGARLFYVAFNWELFSVNPISILTEINSGGLAIYGAIFVCLIYVWLYTIRFKFNTWEFLDILAVSTLLGQVVGRWGNFFNYEAYGPQTTVFWKMFVPDTANVSGDLSARFFHPTFLYEILLNLGLLIFLLYKYEQWTDKRTGLIFSSYCIGYGIIRFFTEFFRLDALVLPIASFLQPNIWILGNIESLKVSQTMSILLVAIGIWGYFQRRRVLYIKNSLNDIYL